MTTAAREICAEYGIENQEGAEEIVKEKISCGGGTAELGEMLVPALDDDGSEVLQKKGLVCEIAVSTEDVGWFSKEIEVAATMYETASDSDETYKPYATKSSTGIPSLAPRNER